MRELVLETIIEQPDMEIVAEIKNEEEILHAVDGTHPDFLVIAPDESGRRPSLCDTWLLRYPKMKILALAPERSVVSFSGPHSIFTPARWKRPKPEYSAPCDAKACMWEVKRASGIHSSVEI